MRIFTRLTFLLLAVFALSVVGLREGGNPAQAANPFTTFLSHPEGIALNGSDIYIADTGACVVRKLSAGDLTTFAGSGTCGYAGDGGAATASQLNRPKGLTSDASALYIADSENCRVRKVVYATGVISTVAGTGTCGGLGDFGLAANAQVNRPQGVFLHGSTGDLYIADTNNHRIRRIIGADIFPEGPGGLNAPRGVWVTGAGATTLYITDTGNCAVKRYMNLTTTVLAGVSGTCGSGSTLLNTPSGIVGRTGALYVTDTANCRVITVNQSGGPFANYGSTGTCGFGGDGTGTGTFDGPIGIAGSSSPSTPFYVADTLNCRARQLGPATVSTIAGAGCAPDLTISNTYGDSRGWLGEVIEHRVEVKNNGTATAPASTLKAYFSTNTTLDAGDPVVATLAVPAIAPGATAIVTYNYTVDWSPAAGGAARTRYFISQADDGNAIAESNETNNKLPRGTGVSLMPYDVDGNGTVNSGDMLHIARTFGATPASVNWNPDADMPDFYGNKNNVINSGDQLINSHHFGESANHVETSFAGTSPSTGTAPLSVTFRHSAFYFEGTVASNVDLDFNGDGTIDLSMPGGASEVKAETPYTFTAPGTYVATMTATDNNGFTDTKTHTITVN